MLKICWNEDLFESNGPISQDFLYFVLHAALCMYLQYSFFAIREKYNPRTIFVYGTEQNNYIISDMSEKDCMSNFLDL